MPGYRETFHSPDLSAIERGEFTLGVPTFRDVIQIENVFSGDDVGRARLGLVREDNFLSIKRTDDRPIQVWINGYSYFEEDPSMMRAGGGCVEVFKAPVDSLSFVNDFDSYWRLLSEGVEINHVARVKVFAEVIGIAAVEKQAKMARQAALQEGFGV